MAGTLNPPGPPSAETLPTAERLIDYHFGTLAPEERAAVEEALLASPAALRLYLQLKRELDGVHPAGERPSSAARTRLREAVAAEVAQVKRAPGAGRSWWPKAGSLMARPVPLYQTIAATCGAACLAALLVGALGLGWTGRRGAEERARTPAAGNAVPGAGAVDFASPHRISMEVL
jgi:hypothetical protein